MRLFRRRDKAWCEAAIAHLEEQIASGAESVSFNVSGSAKMFDVDQAAAIIDQLEARICEIDQVALPCDMLARIQARTRGRIYEVWTW